jgi:hypothetical protein
MCGLDNEPANRILDDAVEFVVRIWQLRGYSLTFGIG